MIWVVAKDDLLHFYVNLCIENCIFSESCRSLKYQIINIAIYILLELVIGAPSIDHVKVTPFPSHG